MNFALYDKIDDRYYQTTDNGPRLYASVRNARASYKQMGEAQKLGFIGYHAFFDSIKEQYGLEYLPHLPYPMLGTPPSAMDEWRAAYRHNDNVTQEALRIAEELIALEEKKPRWVVVEVELMQQVVQGNRYDIRREM